MQRFSRVFLMFILILALVSGATGACAVKNNGASGRALGVQAAKRMADSATIKKGRISIDFVENNDDLLVCYDTIGTKQMADIITLIVDKRYTETVGREFLFTTECMSYEIEAHADGYLEMTNQRNVRSKIVKAYKAYLKLKGYSDGEIQKKIMSSVKAADLKEKDVENKLQSSFFKYRRHIRDAYIDQF